MYEATIELNINGRRKSYTLAASKDALETEQDFWDRLEEAYNDIRNDVKRKQVFRSDNYLEKFDY